MTTELEVSPLDDPTALAGGGAATMLSLAAALGSQLREGFAVARHARGLPSAAGLRSVIVCGVGGSGVAGDVVRAVLADRLPVPLSVLKGYRLPASCGADSLVIPLSFSGNTEETLAVCAEAASRGCRVVTASAGGRLALLAEEQGLSHVALPPDIPMPRAALGFLAAAPLGVLDAMGLAEGLGGDVETAAGALDRLAGQLAPGSPAIDNEAKAIAQWIGDRTPVVWGSEGVADAAAIRWKSQLNENAKVPAFAATLPELDHNEVEGWTAGAGVGYAVLLLRHRGEHERVPARVAATIDALAASGLEFREVHGGGAGGLASLLSLVMIGDFTSVYLAVLRGVDPLPVPILTGLKDRLRR